MPDSIKKPSTSGIIGQDIAFLNHAFLGPRTTRDPEDLRRIVNNCRRLCDWLGTDLDAHSLNHGVFEEGIIGGIFDIAEHPEKGCRVYEVKGADGESSWRYDGAPHRRNRVAPFFVKGHPEESRRRMEHAKKLLSRIATISASDYADHHGRMWSEKEGIVIETWSPYVSNDFDEWDAERLARAMDDLARTISDDLAAMCSARVLTPADTLCRPGSTCTILLGSVKGPHGRMRALRWPKAPYPARTEA